MHTESAFDLAPGSMVGSYRIVKELARGGMATVYEAAHTVLPRRAAVKVMHPELRRLPGMASRMVQEAALLEDVRHPGIVRVFECNVLPDHRPWIAMELVEGETLATRIGRSVLSPVQVASLLADVADVLAPLHAHGVVHRDLKPDNLLMTPGGDYPLRVIDWGVARLGAMARLTLDDATPGTPIYMSPEQAAGGDIGAPCDIYSLGVIAYEALTGEPPFDGRTLAEVVCKHMTSDAQPLVGQGRPIELCALVHSMLQKQPRRRPNAVQVRRVARALVSDLSAVYDDLMITTDHARTPQLVVRDEDDAEITIELGDAETAPELPTQRMRWTPEIGRVDRVPHAIAVQAPVAGEIVLLEQRRRTQPR